MLGGLRGAPALTKSSQSPESPASDDDLDGIFEEESNVGDEEEEEEETFQISSSKRNTGIIQSLEKKTLARVGEEDGEESDGSDSYPAGHLTRTMKASSSNTGIPGRKSGSQGS